MIVSLCRRRQTGPPYITICSIYKLRHRRRRRGRSVFAVGFLDLRAHFFETSPFVHHLHHVTCDAYADASGKAHSIEDWFFRRRVVLEITKSIARVAVGAATAVARDIAESVPVKDCESIGLADFSRSLRNVRGQNILWR